MASAAAHWFGFCHMRAKVPPSSSHVPRSRLGSGSRAAMSFLGAWILDIDVLSRMGRAVLARWDLIDVSSIFL